MPIWLYACPSGHETEVLDVSSLNKSRLPSVPCPTCGQRAVRVPAPVSLHVRAGPRTGSAVSRAIDRVKQAERTGKLD